MFSIDLKDAYSTSRFLSIWSLGCIFGFVSRDVSTSSLPVFQSVHGPTSVHQSLRSGFRVGTLEGRALPSLPERLAGHCGVEDPSSVALGSGFPVVQGSGDHCQLEEVRPPSVHSCPVSGDADRHFSREGVPVGSSSGSLSGSGDFFSASSVTRSVHVAAVVGPHGFTGEFSSSRSLKHVSIAVVPQGPLVPHGARPCRSDPSVAGVRGGSSLVAPRGQLGVQCLSPGSSSVPVATYRRVTVGLGSQPVRSDGFRGVVPGREFAAHQCVGDKAIALALALITFLPQFSGQSVVLMSGNASVVAYFQHQGSTVAHVLCCMVAEVVLWTNRHSVSLMARYNPWKKNVPADQISRPNQVLPTESSLLRIFEGIRGVFGRPHLNLFATHANAKLPLYIFPDGLKAELVPTRLGPSVCLCLPTVCSAQAGLVESASFDWALIGSGGTIVATERVVRRSFFPVG